MNGPRFSDCYCDTYQRGFKFYDGRTLAYITNFRWYIAAETWPTDLPAYVFPANPTGQAMYKVFGADINGSGVTKFSDVDLSSTDELPLVRHRAQPERRTEHFAVNF